LARPWGFAIFNATPRRTNEPEDLEGNVTMSKLLLWLILGLGGASTIVNITLHLPDVGWTRVTAPEIDPAGTIGALMLLAGGLAVLRGRYSKQH
jgi:hypothetical protein